MGLGLPELVLLGVLVALLFGTDRLPDVLGSLGKSAREWKHAIHDASYEELLKPPPKHDDESKEDLR